MSNTKDLPDNPPVAKDDALLDSVPFDEVFFRRCKTCGVTIDDDSTDNACGLDDPSDCVEDLESYLDLDAVQELDFNDY